MPRKQPEGGQDIERLIAQLSDPDVFTRIDAAQALGRLRDTRAIEPLIAALQDREWRVSMEATTALGAIGDARAVEPVAQTLHRDDVFSIGFFSTTALARAVMSALGKLGEPGFQAGMAVLREFVDEEFIGGAAASALGELGDARARDVLLDALHSRIYEVRQAAFQSLTKLGEIAIEPLVAVVLEPGSVALEHARYALREKGAAALPALFAALERTPSSRARAQVLLTLNAFDDARVLDALRAGLSDQLADVREVAALALADRGDLDAFEGALMTPSRDGIGSAVALAQIGAAAVEPLIRALGDHTRPTFARINAAHALGHIGDARALEPLLRAMDEEPTRLAAIYALGTVKDPRCVERLIALTEDSSAEVREAAMVQLRESGDERGMAVLARIAANPDKPTRERLHAISWLCITDPERLLPVLPQLLADDVMSGAAGLVLSRTAKAVPMLIEALRTENREVRRHIARALAGALEFPRDEPGWPDQRIVEALATLLNDADTRVRRDAAIGLGRVKDMRAFSALCELVAQPDMFARTTAARLLEEIGDERAIPALVAALESGKDGGDDQQRSTDWAEGDGSSSIQRAILAIRARIAGETSRVADQSDD